MATASTPTDPPVAHGLDRFDRVIRARLAALLDRDEDAIALERPRREEHGEFALPCFRLAAGGAEKPPQLAARLAREFEHDEVEAEAAGPFLNFRVAGPALARAVTADAARADYGAGTEHHVSIVEFSSPNIAKPMHVGHLRSTVIGAALARLLERQGHRVVRINHVGDWGSQFGKLVAAWHRWGSEEELEREPIAHLLDLYVRYHENEESDAALQEEARLAFRELESGEDNPTRTTWRRFTELSLREFDKVYARFGIAFDHVRGESWYEDKLEGVVSWLDGCGVLERSEGALIVDLEEQGEKTPCMVETAHGTTLYATRDLAAARSRWEEFSFDHALYVVGAEQSLHFRQLKGVLARCGAEWQDRIEHVPFGLIRLTDGRLSTRQGRVIRLKDVLDRAVELAREAIEEKNPELAGKEEIAEQVGIGAVIFHDLKHQRQKDVVFDWKEVLSFEGDTGPYLQYTHARCCSILRKAGRPVPGPESVDHSLLGEAREVLVAVGRLPQAMREAAARREPMILAQALLRMGATGNAFYREHRVLGAGSPELEDARLVVIDALRRALAGGLGLLGVAAPEEM